MPVSTVHRFTDPDAYAATIRATSAQVTLVGRGQFAAKLTRIDLPELWIQRFSETLPRVAHAAGTSRAAITFRTQDGGDLYWNNKDMRASTITRHATGHAAFQRSSGPAHFAAMSLPVDRMIAIAGAVGGMDLAPPADDIAITPPPVALARLLRLHAAAGRLAETAPEIIAHPASARGLEQALVDAMLVCLSAGEQRAASAAHRRHERIMRRFHAAIAAREGDAVYIPELCMAIGVPQRTLNTCCHESLGMSPKQYLLLRRMHLARQNLRAATPAADTVTDIAARFGFWNFGRFAVEYRAQFGESPSETLRRAP